MRVAEKESTVARCKLYKRLRTKFCCLRCFFRVISHFLAPSHLLRRLSFPAKMASSSHKTFPSVLPTAGYKNAGKIQGDIVIRNVGGMKPKTPNLLAPAKLGTHALSGPLNYNLIVGINMELLVPRPTCHSYFLQIFVRLRKA